MKLDINNLRHEQYMRWLDKRDILIGNFVDQLAMLGREYDLDTMTVDGIILEFRKRYEKTQR